MIEGQEKSITDFCETLKPSRSDGCCNECGQPFTEENTHTPEGWTETRISGLCEDCFDAICADDDDEIGDDNDAAF